MVLSFMHKNTKGIRYYLHSTAMAKARGPKDRLYFFAREQTAEHTAEPTVPEGYEVSESKRGLPVLRRIRLERARDVARRANATILSDDDDTDNTDDDDNG